MFTYKLKPIWGSPIFFELQNISDPLQMWRRGVVVITSAQVHSTKSGLRFCAVSNPALGVSGIRDGEDLWQG